MASVQQLTDQIHTLLAQYLPQLAGGGGGEPVTADEIITAIAGALAALGVRASATGQAAGLYVPGVAGDALPAVVIGSTVETGFTSLRVLNTGQHAIHATTTTGTTIRAHSDDETAVRASADGPEPAIGATNTGAGAALGAQSTIGPAIEALASGSATAVQAGAAAGLALLALHTPTAAGTQPIARWRRAGAPAAGDASAQEWTFDGLAGISAQDAVVLVNTTSGGNTRREIGIRRAGNLRTVLIMDGSQSATQTSIQVEADGALRRVKVGPVGSGPGGTGRALFID